MAGIILDQVRENKFLTGQEFERADLSIGDMAAVSMKRTLRFSPTDSIARMLELHDIQSQHERDQSVGRYSAVLTPDQATKHYGIPDQLSFDSPVAEGVAKLLNKRKQEEMVHEVWLSKAHGAQKAGLLGIDLLSSMLDPINVGSAFIPIVGQARYASMLTRYGTTKARALRGLAEGTVGNAMVEPFVYSAAKMEQSNYTEIDTLLNITFGGILGTGLHVVGGRIGDSIRGVETKVHHAAVKTSVNQMSQGGQVQVEPIIGSSNVNTVENVNIINFDEPALSESLTPEQIDAVKEAEGILEFINLNKGTQLYKDGDLTDGDILQDIVQNLYAKGIPPDIQHIMDSSDGPDAVKKVLDAITAKATKDADLGNPVLLDKGQEKELAFLNKELTNLQELETKAHDMKEAEFDDDEIVDTLLVGLYGSDDFDAIGDSLKDALDSGFSNAAMVDEILGVIQDKKAVLLKKIPQVKAQASTNSVGSIVSDGPQEYSDLYYGASRLEEAINTENFEGTGEINLGSQIGEIKIDKATGKKYYVKTPASPVHAANEFTTGLLYRALGADMPNVRLVMENDRVVGVASEFIEDLVPMKVSSDIGNYSMDFPDQHKRFMATVMFDAWLGNWDAYAPGNIFTNRSNEIVRLDFGGGLLFRAQGEEKVGWGVEVKELTDFHNFNNSMSVWKSLSPEELDKMLVIGAEAIAGMDPIKISNVVGGAGLPAKEAAKVISLLVERRNHIMLKFKDKIDPSKSNFIEFFDTQNAIKHTSEAIDAAHYTKEELNAISNYQGGSTGLNKYLRGQSGVGATSYGKLATTLDSALLKTTIKAPIVLYRGGLRRKTIVTDGTPKGITSVEQAQQAIGHVIQDDGFMSTSPSRGVAIKFGTNNMGGKDILLRIHLPSGSHAIVPNAQAKMGSQHAFSFKDEAEFILPRETPLQIIAVEKLHGVDRIVLTVRPVAKNTAPASPKAQVKMAAAYKEMASSAADDNVMEEEFAVALSEAFKTADNESLLNTIKSVTDELEQEVADLLDDTIANELADVNSNFNDTTKVLESIKKGSMKALHCILGKI